MQSAKYRRVAVATQTLRGIPRHNYLFSLKGYRNSRDVGQFEAVPVQLSRMRIATLIAYADTVALPLDWLTAAVMGLCGKHLGLTLFHCGQQLQIASAILTSAFQ